MGGQRHPAGLVLLGLIAGIVAFVGCFVSFFSGGATGTILNGNSFWFYFVPVLLGLATLALLVPRATVAAIFPLGAVAIALGAKATIDGLQFDKLAQGLYSLPGASASNIPPGTISRLLHSQFGPGPGFFMIVIAGTVLALIWARIVHDMVVARFGSITEIVAIRASAPASPGASSGDPASPSAAPDMTTAPAPDPGSPGST